MYEYRAQVLRVVDGDTLDVHIDLGFSVLTKQRIRLLGINTAEKNTPKGKETKAFVESLLPVGTWVTLRTAIDKKEKFGRILGVITLEDEKSTVLNDYLIASGHAMAYFGVGSKDEHVPQ